MLANLSDSHACKPTTAVPGIPRMPCRSLTKVPSVARALLTRCPCPCLSVLSTCRPARRQRRATCSAPADRESTRALTGFCTAPCASTSKSASYWNASRSKKTARSLTYGDGPYGATPGVTGSCPRSALAMKEAAPTCDPPATGGPCVRVLIPERRKPGVGSTGLRVIQPLGANRHTSSVRATLADRRTESRIQSVGGCADG